MDLKDTGLEGRRWLEDGSVSRAIVGFRISDIERS
jgi:hypothetical protein